MVISAVPAKCTCRGRGTAQGGRRVPPLHLRKNVNSGTPRPTIGFYAIVCIKSAVSRGHPLNYACRRNGLVGETARRERHAVGETGSHYLSEYRDFAMIRPIVVGGLLLTASLPLWEAQCFAAKPKKFMLKARIDGELVEGQPLAWTNSQMLLLGRDGQLHDFHPDKAKDARRSSPRFFGYTISEMRTQLQTEFDKRFDVTSTNTYLIVHPAGQKSVWADRFEELYRSFNHYFRVRGFRPRKPKFPLVAIVFRDKNEYYQYVRASGGQVKNGLMGHYSPSTNRVYMFDVTGGRKSSDWSINAETIIHEASHQMAYNIGVHTRFTATPRWVVEGLATMFEARGVWDSRSYQTRADRVNREQLRNFNEYVAKRRKKGAVASILASDSLFRSDVFGAYAEAWALSFYLCETQPRVYSRYLERTADRELFSNYGPAERVADFRRVVDSDLKMFEAKFLRYMEEL